MSAMCALREHAFLSAMIRHRAARLRVVARKTRRPER
jgi:hypothetical protein